MCTSQPAIVETTRLTANCCPKHPGSDFWVSCKNSGWKKSSKKENYLLVPTDSSQWGEPSSQDSIIVHCDQCHRVTVHVPVCLCDDKLKPKKWGWKTVRPTGWRGRVKFSWDQRTDHWPQNIRSIYYRTIFRTKMQVTFVDVPSGYKNTPNPHTIWIEYTLCSHKLFIATLRRLIKETPLLT